MREVENELFEARISKKTLAILKRNGIVVNYSKPDKPITKKRYINIVENFDLLQHYGMVRTFICNKYDLQRGQLETLCAVYPIGVFTKTEYDSIPKNHGSRMVVMVEKKLIENIFGGETYRSQPYQLTKLGKSIVRMTHTYLLEPSTMPLLKNGFEYPHREKKKFNKMDKLIRSLKALK